VREKVKTNIPCLHFFNPARFFDDPNSCQAKDSGTAGSYLQQMFWYRPKISGPNRNKTFYSISNLPSGLWLKFRSQLSRCGSFTTEREGGESEGRERGKCRASRWGKSKRGGELDARVKGRAKSEIFVQNISKPLVFGGPFTRPIFKSTILILCESISQQICKIDTILILSRTQKRSKIF